METALTHKCKKGNKGWSGWDLKLTRQDTHYTLKHRKLAIQSKGGGYGF